MGILIMFTALGQGLGANPQHMMQFAPLLYSYQMAMAQAAQVAGECYLQALFQLDSNPNLLYSF